MQLTSAPASSSRRRFLAHSLGAAAVVAASASAPLILTSRKSIVRASSFPPFDTSGIGTANLNNFTATFLAMANDMYDTGSTSASNFNNAQEYWGILYGQLSSSGFDSAALTYLSNGAPDVDPQLNPLYNLLVENGLKQGWGYFYHYLNGVINPLFSSNAAPAINTYGLPDSNYGHQCALAHWGTGAAAIKPAGLPPNESPSICIPISLGVSPSCAGPSPAGGSPGASENFCWWLNAFLAYAGIMAIPLSLEGAAFPPLGIGMGIAVAFAGVFAAGFCG
jgi:hypothetical protein